MNTKDAFRKGAETVGNAAAEKFDQLKGRMEDIRDNFKQYAAAQDDINDFTTERVDRLGDEVRALKDNKQYIKASRHSLDDMDEGEQELVFTWLGKVLGAMEERGFGVSEEQRAFLLNLRKYIGLLDESFEIQDLSQLEKMGEGSTHQVIYKIFLALIYLHDASLEPLTQLDDVDGMFKLSAATKKEEQELLRERVRTLGIEGLVAMYDQERPISSFTVANVLSQHIELGGHPALTWNLSKNELGDYVRAFALLALAAPEDDAEQLFSFSDKQKDFLAALGKQFGCQTVLFEMNELCKNPRNVNIKALQNILDGENKKYTWFLDCIFVAACRQKIFADDRLFISIAQSIKLDDPNLPNFMATAMAFCGENTQETLAKQIIDDINPKTDGWKHILNFRGLNLKATFADVRGELDALEDAIWNIKSSIQSSSLGVSSLLMESFVKQLAKRGEYFKQLNEDKDAAVSLILGRGDNDCSRAIKVVSLYIKEHSYYDRLLKAKLSASMLQEKKYSPDAGEDWDAGLDRGVDAVEKILNTLEDLAQDLDTQLRIFEEGRFNETVEEQRRKENEAKKRAQEEERQAKSVATLDVNGKNICVRVTWEEWGEDKLPFASSDLRGAATDGTKWLVYTSKKFYVCRDGEKWISLDALPERSPDSIKYIGKYWIVEQGEHIYFSENTMDWKELPLPPSCNYKLSIFFDSTQWILRCGTQSTYSYTKKGLIWDSTEESTYHDKPKFYRTRELGERWEEWSEANDISKGLSIVDGDSFASNYSTYVSAFSINAGYYCNTNMDISDDYTRIMYLKNKQKWKESDIEHFYDSTLNFVYFNNCFLLITRSKVYTSEKGFTWQKQDICTSCRVGKCHDMLMLFPENSDSLHLTADGQNFVELKLPEGKWNILAGQNEQLLAIWHKNEHEAFLMQGTVHYNK